MTFVTFPDVSQSVSLHVRPPIPLRYRPMCQGSPSGVTSTDSLMYFEQEIFYLFGVYTQQIRPSERTPVQQSFFGDPIPWCLSFDHFGLLLVLGQFAVLKIAQYRVHPARLMANRANGNLLTLKAWLVQRLYTDCSLLIRF